MKSSGIFLSQQGAGREHFHKHHSLISWRAVIAGLFLAVITYVCLTMLGLAVAGETAYEIIQESSSAKGLAAGAATWLGLSILLSLGIGSYFAARTSLFVTRRIGAAQGLLIASIFFGLMGYGIISGFGSVVKTIGMSAQSLANNPIIQNKVEDSLGGLNLKNKTSTVVEGVVSRLVAKDSDAARTYLINETGLPAAAVNARLVIIEKEFRATAKMIAAEAAYGIAKSAWLMFTILIAGIAMASLGGAAGSWLNFKDPLIEEDHTHLAAPTPFLATTIIRK